MEAKRLIKKAYYTWRTEGTGKLLKKTLRYLSKKRTACPEYQNLQLVHIAGCADSLCQKEAFDLALRLPFGFETPQHSLRLAATVHIFYPDLADDIMHALQNVPGNIDVFVSTDTDEKKQQIVQAFTKFTQGNVTVKVFPNRGRDIAPAFVGFANIYESYDACVHFHSKKSPHDADKLAGWRDYLYHNILGSKEIVSDILHILATTDVGLVFPQHFYPLRESINWGQDYEAARKFLLECGISINNHHLLEFPAGSMFWFKPKAVRPLLQRKLSFENFPTEGGQIDGTIAHAIERSFLYMAESEGFKWAKINSQTNATGNTPIVDVMMPEDLTSAITKVWQPVMKQYESTLWTQR